MNIINDLLTKTAKSSLKIAALGDSLTYGWLVNKGYLDFLSEMLKEKYPGISISIKNFGVPGDTAADGLRRISDVIKSDPDLCLVQFALNDAFTGMTPGRFKETFEKIILKIKESTTAEIILLTSVPVNSPYENRIAESFYNMIIECGGEHNIPVAKIHEYWKKKIESGISHSSLVQGDGVHPVEKGYRFMAEAVIELL